jgi:Zn-dependent protease with chaperone function
MSCREFITRDRAKQATQWGKRMSDKAKKQASELSFSISKWFSKISTMKPSSVAVTAVVLGAAVFLLGGGVYDIINQPAPAVYVNNRFYFLYTRSVASIFGGSPLSEQFIFGTVLSVILYVLGFVGLLTLYKSAKNVTNQTQAYMSMVIGITLVALAYIFLEYFIHLKLTG